jgi:hypothetical protein
MIEMRKVIKSKGCQRFGSIDYRKVYSILSMYEGVEAFYQHVEDHGTSEFKSLF